MNKRFYFLCLRAGMAILLFGLAALYVSISHKRVFAQFPNSTAPMAFASPSARLAPLVPLAPSAPFVGCATPNFSPAPTSPEPAGTNPHFIEVGDLNGDGNPDIVSTNYDSASVTILLGDGTGNFTIFGSAIPVQVHPVTAEVGDYNNDGKQDIAVCNEGSDSVSILIGNGTGAFTQPSSPIAVGVHPRTVVKGFFNNDSNLDLATTNGGSNNLTILLGNGNGTFTQALGSPVAGGSAPFHAVVGNFNADGFSDMAVANLGGGTVTIFLGNGSGGFSQFGAEIFTGTFASYIAMGQFNGDSNLDLAVCNRLSNNVTVLLGNGNGGFSQAAGSPYNVGSAPMGVATADLNMDGIADLAIANENSANTTILLGNGLGGFGTPTTVLKGLLPTHIALSDFNGDGKTDIATSDGGDNTVTILLNMCNSCSPVTVNPATVAAGTVNSAYSTTFTGSGGATPYSLSLTGSLPTGLAFNSPTLSGTPTQTGSFPITVTATDNNGCSGSRNYTLTVGCQSITVNPTTIATGTVNTFYNQSFTQTGGFGTTTFSVTGTLPTGLSFSGTTISGTPTQSGNFPITVIATDSNGCTGSRAYTLSIGCQTITVNPTTISSGTVNTAYSQMFTQTGGTGTTTFSLTSGTLPTGLTFSAGTISGTPTQRGNFPITVTATDANGCTGSAIYTLVINCQTNITVNPATIPAGTAGTAYSQTFTQTGGVGTTTFSVLGTLPTGMTFSGATLSGTPTQTGSFPITVTATDSNACTGSTAYTLVINCQTITVNPTTIATGTAGAAYSQTFTQTGGTGTTTFSINAKQLPSGLTFAGATLSGTPTEVGSFPVTVTATDSNGCTGSRNYTLVINCQTITVNPATIATAATGTAYSQSFTQSGGIGTTSFSLTGTLPTGLTFTGATLSGTPTQSGSFPISVTATDANGCAGSRNYTLLVNCQSLSVNPATIATGTVNAAYSQTFTQTGGVGSVTFSLSGALPAGLSFSAATATLSGTPTQTGSFPVTVSATDSTGCIGGRNYTLVIGCQTITVNPATIATGTAGTAYTQAFTQTGGVGTTTLSLSGTLPTGLTFSAGTISGTPTQTGNFPITVTATDSNGCTGNRAYTLTINCSASITVNPATIAAGTAGVAYSQTFTQTGGVGTTTFSLSAKQLPSGLVFSGATLSGTPTQTGSFPITITATDSNGCTGSRNYTLIISCQTITVNPAAVAAGTAGAAYSQSFTQTGGIGTTAFSLTGTLPTGLTFSGATLSGTPTQTGSFPITVGATDINGCVGSRNYTLVINCPTISVNPASLPNGVVGISYGTQTLSATGGVGAYTFAVSVGTLPTGVTLSGATLSGTPTTAGTYNFTLRATDANGCQGTRAYTVVVTTNPTGLQYFSLSTPVRLLDTRSGQSACFVTGSKITGGSSLTQSAAGVCSIPAGAKAIVGNVTTYQSSGSNNTLTLYASDIARPSTSSSFYTSSQTLNNAFTVGLGASDGAFKIYASGTTHVIVDVTGYFAAPATNGLYYHSLPTPIRILETRSGQPGCVVRGSTLPGGSDTTVQGTMTCGGVTIPATAKALVGNATTVSPTGSGWITLYAANIARPSTSNGNYTSGQTLNSPFTVALSSAGQFKVYTTDQTHMVIDVQGYYSTDATDVNGQGLLFSLLTSPTRLLETRSGFSGCFVTGTQLQAGVEQSQLARGTCTINASAQTIVGNATVVNNASAGFLTLWSSNLATRPLAAASNWTANRPLNRHFTVTLGSDGKFKMYASSTTDLVVDVTGYFAP